MWNGERVRYSLELPKKIPGNIKIYLVRHGEVERHDNHEPTLTAKGSEQARKVADDVFPYIEERLKQGVVVNIHTFYAKLDRTTRTAVEIDWECRQLKVLRGLTEVIIFPPTASPILEASDSIEPLMKRGISKHKAIYLWLTEDELNLANWGVRTFPSDVHRKLRRFIEGTNKLYARWGSRDNILFWVTQETVQIALLNYLAQQDPIVMEYAESIEIIPKSTDGETVYQFRGKKYFEKKKNPDVNA